MITPGSLIHYHTYRDGLDYYISLRKTSSKSWDKWNDAVPGTMHVHELALVLAMSKDAEGIWDLMIMTSRGYIGWLYMDLAAEATS